jgi:putative PEP-CTERM system integral membrane protein
MNSSEGSLPPEKASFQWGRGIFWAWNVVFVAFMLLGFAPNLLPSLIRSIQDGTTPPGYLAFCIFLIIIPLIAVILGGLFLRKDSSRLAALGYVVEWPLLLILLFRFFLIREGNPAITILLVWLAVGEAALLWHLLDRKTGERRPFWVYLRLGGLTLLFAGTLYAAVWLLFYLPPFVVMVIRSIPDMLRGFLEQFRNLNADTLRAIPFILLGIVLLTFSGSLILVMPVVAPVIAGRAWLSSLRAGIKAGRRWLAAVAIVLPLAIVLSALAIGMQQPQGRAFSLLENPPGTLEQARMLLQQQSQIRSGLVNAYLAPFRYMSAVGEVRHVSDMYTQTLGFSQPVAWKFEQAYETWIWPLLYVSPHAIDEKARDNSAFTRDPQEAAQLYESFFDRTLIDGERQKIVDAVRSTYNGSQAEAAWQVVDDREVHLNKQEVTIIEHGDWAEIELHEVYENRTFTRQEVVYYFSLPESAVVTGLWLGSGPERSKAFQYRVAPRGAAQAVYRNQILYNMDPALVEQIGPRQYRLRIFPIEPRIWDNSREQDKPGPELQVWMTYQATAVNGAWPLPQLAEKRNVFWDVSTIHMANGKILPSSGESWLPESVKASQEVTQQSHRVTFPGGQTVLVLPAASVKPSPVADHLRLAIVLDRSFSMSERAGEVNQAIARLKQAAGNAQESDVYLTSSKYRGEVPLRVGLANLAPDKMLDIGGQNGSELLKQFEDLQAGQKYDLIFVLTDGTGYKLGTSNKALNVTEAPVWVVHLGGGFPLGYDDPTLQAIQVSGGGVASSVDEALARFAAAQGAPGRLDIIDGYEWLTLPTGESNGFEDAAGSATPASQDDGFIALAARRVILAEMARNRGKLDQLPVLDQLHKLAIDTSIVTPYSSMLVLVNDRQVKQLEEMEAGADRFQREAEKVGETVSTNPLAVTGIPEPEEWLLGLVALLVLGYAYRRKLGRRVALR